MRTPSNLHDDNERVGKADAVDWDPAITLGPPNSRFRMDLKTARKVLIWLRAAVAWAEWRDKENKRIEREENA